MLRPFPLAVCLPLILSAQKQPFDFPAMMKISRIAEPALSPDGKWVAYSVQTIDLPANARPRHIWISPIDGGTPRKLTKEGTSNERPRWSPDSKRIYYASNRSGSSQIWAMDPDGGNARQVTTLSTEASGHLISPDGKRIVFLSSVYPDCGPDDACNKRRIDEEEKSKVKARVYTTLLYRHWNQWQTVRRQHILSMPISGGAAKDLTPGNRDVPPFSLGGPDDYAISPDSAEVAYVTNLDPELAVSTNSDIFTVPIEGGEPKKVTHGLGADNAPAYSPDGKRLAFRSQMRAGYESDRWRLSVIERSTGLSSVLTDEGLDRNVDSFTWFPDSSRIFFVIEDRGRHPLQMIASTGGSARTIISGASTLDDVQFTHDGRTMIYTEQSGSRPVEIFRATSGSGAGTALTRMNEQALAGYSISPLEEFWVEGAEKARVHSFLIKPPEFNASRKYPVLVLIHGGPQGAWGESWSYRWNPQVFASAGFVVVMPNPRGSTGYGQKFTDDINQDWGGKVYEDIMASVDHVAAQPWADPNRMAAAGGSYGGYMANWLLGHTTRFKAMVSHAGVFDLKSMGLETEELWFTTWEFRGMPWENPEVYQKWSPSNHIKEFKTPTLVIHGELDYRVPVGQGLQLFTALQMQKVPSKLLLFPDEGHWILKPQNSELWYKSFLEWVGEWTKKVGNN